VRGKVQGESDVQGAVVIANGGHWVGLLKADIVVVAGQVEGDILAAVLVFPKKHAETVGKFLGQENISRIRQREIPRLRRRIGVVFQDFKLIESKTVEENIKFALEIMDRQNQSCLLIRIKCLSDSILNFLFFVILVL